MGQPWAWAIAVAGKDVENRGWSTTYRGLLAIHAGKGQDDPDDLPDAARRTYEQAARLPGTHSLRSLLDRAARQGYLEQPDHLRHTILQFRVAPRLLGPVLHERRSR